MSPPADLCQIKLRIQPDVEEAIVALFEEVFGFPPVVEVDAETARTIVSVFLPRASEWSPLKRAALAMGLQHLRECGVESGSGKIIAKAVSPENWAESWKRHFKPILIGSSLLIKPPWSRRKAAKNQAVVVLMPGLSFGTGQHPPLAFV